MNRNRSFQGCLFGALTGVQEADQSGLRIDFYPWPNHNRNKHDPQEVGGQAVLAQGAADTEILRVDQENLIMNR